MSILNSIHIADEGIYYSKLNVKKKIPVLESIGLIPLHININANQLQFDNNLIDALKSLFNFLGQDLNSINVSFQNDSVLLSFVPFAGNNTASIKDILNIEIENRFVDFRIDDFIPTLYPHGKYALSQLFFRSSKNSLNKALYEADIHISKFTSGLVSTINAINYNYPDIINNGIMLYNFRGDFVDISIIDNEGIQFYQESNKTSILLDDYAHELISKFNNRFSFQNLLLYGKDLTPEILRSFKRVSEQFAKPTDRINPFRMIRSALNSIQQKDCLTKRHLYSELIGNSIPDYYRSIKI